MDCSDESFCWTYSLLPDLPPPPPLPSFLLDEIKGYLNETGTATSEDECNLCNWAGAGGEFGPSTSSGDLSLSTLLTIVALVSALAGAGLTAAVLSFRRLRSRKFESASGSVRHLARKISTSSRPTLPLPPVYPTGAFAENTYCEGPYNNDKDLASNIYAELHSGIPGEMWGRPPVAHSAQNCYLELKDLPNRCRRCLPPVPHLQATAESVTYSPSSSAYYSDLDLAAAQTAHAAAMAARHQAIAAHPV